MKNLLKIISIITILFPSFLYATNDQQEQIKTITAFYKNYLDQKYEEGWPSIYSSRLIKALEDNINDCRKFIRNGNICGYTADGDLLLNAQDYSPTLRFSNSNFSATTKPNNVITVNFVLFPEEEQDKGDRELNFTMAKENNLWKIDDMESSAYESMNAEREALIETNLSLENAVTDLQGSFEYGDDKNFSQFIASQSEICANKSCHAIKQSDLANIYRTLFDKYFTKTGEYSVEQKLPLVPAGTKFPSTPKEGDIAQTGIFSWRYQDQLWMITKIDLDKI